MNFVIVGKANFLSLFSFSFLRILMIEKKTYNKGGIMSRIARKDITASYIHVITQGIKKEYIFRKDKYKEEYIKLLQKVFQECDNLHLLTYCIMDNHVHLLIYTQNVTELSKLMSRVNTSYGIYYNKCENRVGYVFRNRYYSQAIMSEKHLYNTVAYIHNNPVKAKMVKEMKDYEYSSYNSMKNGKLDKQCINLLFFVDNYFEKFNEIHKSFSEKDILEVSEDITSDEEIKYFVKKFCQDNKIRIDEINKNNYLLNLVITQIKDKYSVTNKKIAEIFGIGKNRITNLKKHCNNHNYNTF